MGVLQSHVFAGILGHPVISEEIGSGRLSRMAGESASRTNQAQAIEMASGFEFFFFGKELYSQ